MFKSNEPLERMLMHCCQRHLIDDFSIEGDGVTLTVGNAVHKLTTRHASEYVAWLLEQENMPGLPDPQGVLSRPPDAGASSAPSIPDDG
jgi:hypothetical protein